MPLAHLLSVHHALVNVDFDRLLLAHETLVASLLLALVLALHVCSRPTTLVALDVNLLHKSRACTRAHAVVSVIPSQKLRASSRVSAHVRLANIKINASVLKT